MLCSKCKKNVAVIFVSKIENGSQTNEGICMSCAKDMGIKPLDDIMSQMGLDAEQIDSGMNELINAGELEIPEHTSTLNTSPLDFINKIFSGTPDQKEQGENEQKRQKTEEKDKTQKNQNKKRKVLDSYGINLTKKAKAGEIDRIVGREREINRVIQILNRRTKNNPVLLGEPGVGKTAVAEGLALKISNKEVPVKLYEYEVYLVDFAALVAGTQFRGQFEARLKSLIDEVKAQGNIILVIDEVHNIVGAGEAEGAMNAANILKPALSRGEVQVIGATTLSEYRKYIEKDAALERRFQPVIIDEPTIDESIEIINGIKDYYESYHRVSISTDVIKSAVILAERYISDRFLPDKAIDVIDEAASKVNLNNTGLIELVDLKEELKEVQADKENAILSDSIEDYQKAADLKITECRLSQRINELESCCGHVPVTVEDVATVIEQWTKIPVQRITELDAQKLMQLEERLHTRVVGQDKAIDAVSRAIRRARVGINRKRRPVSFIFAGPTGVGKTELAKAIAQMLFGSEQALIRLDMSEYMEKHSVSKIIGSPPGYVGYDEAGQLTEKIRRNPYSVILLDEMEKAHADVFNMLLQILDDGRITDSHGRVINFENTVIIMTTNAGSNLKSGAMGFGGLGALESKYEKTLKDLFRPEFLNRIDEIVEFTALSREELMNVVDLLMTDLNMGLAEKSVTMVVEQSAKEFVLDKGYDPKYGARPLRRAIQRYIEDKVADMFLRGEIKEGDRLVIGSTEGEMSFIING